MPFRERSFWQPQLFTAGIGCWRSLAVSCGLRLDDEAVRVAVVLRLGLDLGALHTCRRASSV